VYEIGRQRQYKNAIAKQLIPSFLRRAEGTLVYELHVPKGTIRAQRTLELP
jgi:hypothetical protein